MVRRAFTMRLKPGALAEYRYHHDHLWPELAAEIERSGITSITTFQQGLDLILVSEVSDDGAWDRLWNSEVHKRWAEVMQPLMHLREDGIVDAGELSEVFHFTPHRDGNGQPKEQAAAIVQPTSETTMESSIDSMFDPESARAREEMDAQALADALSESEITVSDVTIEEVLIIPVDEPMPAAVEPAAAVPRKRAAKKKAPAKKAKGSKKKVPAKAARSVKKKATKKKAAKKSAKKAAKKAPKKASKKKAPAKKAVAKKVAKKAAKKAPKKAAGKKKRK